MARILAVGTRVDLEITVLREVDILPARYASSAHSQFGAPCDLELGAELGVARGVQWWYPYTLVQCKVVNVTNTLKTLQRGTVVANVYAMNASDAERIQLLVEPPLPGPRPRRYQ